MLDGRGVGPVLEGAPVGRESSSVKPAHLLARKRMKSTIVPSLVGDTASGKKRTHRELTPESEMLAQTQEENRKGDLGTVGLTGREG